MVSHTQSAFTLKSPKSVLYYTAAHSEDTAPRHSSSPFHHNCKWLLVLSSQQCNHKAFHKLLTVVKSIFRCIKSLNTCSNSFRSVLPDLAAATKSFKSFNKEKGSSFFFDIVRYQKLLKSIL